MKERFERVCGKLISQAFKVINPIKKKIITTDCEVHLFIQNSAIDVLEEEGYDKQVQFYKNYKSYIDEGLVWADQDFKSYFHFYNPTDKKGMYGHSANAMTLANSYYKSALYFISKDDYENGMAYFGAMCHLIQDVTIPQHAKRRLLDNHRQFEKYVKLNYKRVKKFKTKEGPLLYKNVSDYINFNSRSALNFDHMYKNIAKNKTKFYLVAYNALNLSQRSTAGCMLMFYDDLEMIRKNDVKSKKN
ncbi:zinc dependent phospholipase C family protein [Terrisporobacter sp.]